MSDTPVHLALRELRAAYADPVTLAVIAGVGVVAGLAGPFGTFEQLGLGARLAYWIAIAAGTYGAGLLGANLVQHMLRIKPKPLILRVIVLALGASVPVTAVVVAISMIAFSDIERTGLGLAELYVYCLGISLALMAVIEGVVPQTTVEKSVELSDVARESDEKLQIFARLPAHLGRELTHMSMADHYVEVFTKAGKAMVLMRLSDAIAETRGIDGLQIHRSHWVARDAIAGLTRENGRPVVTLVTGVTLPVSRTYLDAVRAAVVQK